MPTCEELVEQLRAIRRNVVAVIGSESDRFDRLDGRY